MSITLDGGGEGPPCCTRSSFAATGRHDAAKAAGSRIARSQSRTRPSRPSVYPSSMTIARPGSVATISTSVTAATPTPATRLDRRDKAAAPVDAAASRGS